ncbi:diaminobutyrate--2-oxoglutarate transaminase [Halocatena halophila]|uniref:diaminobutyrate--2-oxoglutarate transaminase n=1 Tax=Halocatena halophila TaxID=2814576 RepID=UPI002ED39AE4
MTTNGQLLAQQANRESNARTYPRHLPIALDSASGMIVTDVSGEEYLDCLSGAGSMALGHNHPVVTEAIERALGNDRPLHTLDLTTPIKERFVDTLFESLPTAFARHAKIQFCSPAGTDAIEAALKLVKAATGNEVVYGFQGGYHGMTAGALGLMGDESVRAGIPGLRSNGQQLPFPYSYRSPFGDDGDHTTASGYVERLLDDPNAGLDAPAGLLTEIVQGEGGVIPAPDQWVREIRRITREREIPLIVDEVQTGLGRTGALYAFEHAGITPDVVVLSKAIGGGLPLSAVVYHERLDSWAPGAHAGTFRGGQLAMAAGQATIDYVMENDLASHADRMGARLLDHLARISTAYPTIGDCRGRGLMLGVEIVDPDVETDGPRPAAPELAASIQQGCLERGLIVERGGRHSATVRFLPPLIVTADQIDEVAEIFESAVEAAAFGGASP